MDPQDFLVTNLSYLRKVKGSGRPFLQKQGGSLTSTPTHTHMNMHTYTDVHTQLAQGQRQEIVWWCIHVIPALRRLKQEKGKFKVSQGYIVRPISRTNEQKSKQEAKERLKIQRIKR